MQTLDQIFGGKVNVQSPPITAPQGDKPSLESIFGTPAINTRPSLESIFNAPPPEPKPFDVVQNLMDKSAEGAVGGFNQIRDSLKQLDENAKSDKSIPAKILGVGGSAFHGAMGGFKLATAPLSAMFDTVTGGKFSNVMGDIQKSIDQGKGLGQIKEVISNNPTIQKIAMNHPHAEQFVSDLTDAIVGILGFKEGPEALKSAEETGVKTMGDIKGPDGPVGKVTQMASNVKDAITGKVTSIFKGKTQEEILTTPEDQLHKLSPEDRKVYFDVQRDAATEAHTLEQEKINQKSSETESKIKADSEKKIADLETKTQDLTNQADRASLEEVQGLKPKVISSMAENSKAYRELIDKEMSGKENTPVSADELKAHIESKYADNPAKATAIKERLGLNEPAPKVDAKGLPTIEAGGSSLPDTTLGKLYENVKELKQDIGKPAKKGSRVYTPEEKLTDDAISTLSGFMKSKGIDFSEANRFWSNYAPLRDKIIRNVQPFTPRGSETATFNTFAKKVQNSIRGVDEGNKDFISAIEDLLGKKIGNPKVRAALEKLDANQKSIMAEKIDASNKLEETKATKEQGSKEAKRKLTQDQKTIENNEFEINRKATTRTNVFKALRFVLGNTIAGISYKLF